MPLTQSHRSRGSMPGEDVEIIEVTEKHSVLYNAIPCLPLAAAIALCVLNIVVPGLGTFLSAWTCLCGCPTKLGKPAKALCLNLVAALLQCLTFAIIVGWVWSIIWGMNFISIASKSAKVRAVVDKAEAMAVTSQCSRAGGC